ncbi:MAG: GAF domain-containing protein [Deltaproteobacteria bacterium]|nr:GAF domain-containing protein [Deltaproteobacteria bacterium]
MSSSSSTDDKTNEPLYSSRLIKNYVEYIRHHYPKIDMASFLNDAWMTVYELEDEGHWFTQWQVDRFHKVLEEKTGRTDIAREVGRFMATSNAPGQALRQYVVGFLSPSAAFWLLEKFAVHISKATTIKTNRLSSNKMEVISIPKPGVHEKPYQCENRMGILEAIAKLFTNKYAEIEHTTCIHKGHDLCRYVVTWEKAPLHMWRRVRYYLISFGLMACAALYFFLPSLVSAAAVFFFTALIVGIVFYSESLENNELIKTIQNQKDTAEHILNQIDIRYNDSLLIKEVGQVTSSLLDIDRLLKKIVDIMEKRLDFDRGGIWLVNQERTRLIYSIGYGYDEKIEDILQSSHFHLDNPFSMGVAVQAFKKQKPYLINDVSEISNSLSQRSQQFVKQMGTKSFICLPIVYEGESIGMLFVDNLKSKRPLRQSDISLLTGITSQIAISISNAMSYKKLVESKEREKNLRKLFEKYVPAPVIKRYVNSGDVDLFKGEMAAITAFFLDIRGFTASLERLAPEKALTFLNSYFDECSVIISKEGGHINKYTGDGFLAIFGAPELLEKHVSLAFNSACKIFQMSRHFILGDRPMAIGIGLHTGNAILGNLGSKTKMEYTAIGDTVNIAARLQELTKDFHECPIIMSRDVWIGLSNHPLRKGIKNLGVRKIRGKTGRFEAFGFHPMKGHVTSLADHDSGFVPLDKVKGV